MSEGDARGGTGEPSERGAAAQAAAPSAQAAPGAHGDGERRDEDGLPLDRPATLDDVRGDAGSGRAMALGCSLLVALAILAFWALRGGLLG